MVLLLLFLGFLGLNALAWWCGVDTRDGRDWTPVPFQRTSSSRG